jgi:hypothetical protein
MINFHPLVSTMTPYFSQKNQRFQVIVNGCKQSTSSLAKPLRGFPIHREYEAPGKLVTTDRVFTLSWNLRSRCAGNCDHVRL